MQENDKFSSYTFFTQENAFDFALHSTIGCGGIAKRIFYPKTELETFQLIEKLHLDAIPYFVIGKLSNVLPPDRETDTVLISLQYLQGISAAKGVYVQAGVTSASLLRYCVDYGRSGAEFLTGIPCTLGGALYMNAGVSEAHMSDIVQSVTVVEPDGVKILSVKDCAYAYKSSRFMQTGGVIVGARLKLFETNPVEVKQKIDAFNKKRAWLPKGRSMGCVFKNPDGQSAGVLIEKSGLKGVAYGKARVSDVHANFIINEGTLSKDVETLIAIVKQKVKEKQGVVLQEEIRYLR